MNAVRICRSTCLPPLPAAPTSCLPHLLRPPATLRPATRGGCWRCSHGVQVLRTVTLGDDLLTGYHGRQYFYCCAWIAGRASYNRRACLLALPRRQPCLPASLLLVPYQPPPWLPLPCWPVSLATAQQGRKENGTGGRCENAPPACDVYRLTLRVPPPAGSSCLPTTCSATCCFAYTCPFLHYTHTFPSAFSLTIPLSLALS